MLVDILPNTRLAVKSVSRVDKDPSLVMASTFEDILSDGSYLITAPIYKEIQVPLQPGEVLGLSYMDKNASYSFEAEIAGRVQKDSLYFLKIKRTTKITRMQKRQDFRLEMTLEGKLDRAVVDQEGGRKVRRAQVLTKDLSGGGTLIRPDTRLYVDENVVIHLPLGDYTSMRAFSSSVRWCEKANQTEKPMKWEAGLMFIHKNPAEKEELIKYLFAAQQKMRKKEIGKYK